MLLPESHRSRLPFVASLTLQCSFVLLLAIPWTVQTLRSGAAMQTLTTLNLEKLSPAKPVTRKHDSETLRSPSPNRSLSRVFQIPSRPLNDSTTDLPSAPDAVGVDFGPVDNSGAVAHALDSIRSVPTLAPPPVVPVRETRERVVVGGVVQAAKLIRQVQPVYPAIARQARIQGIVALEAIIGMDGGIQQLRVISGHPFLVSNAVSAVQQWIYRPTFLNGKAVEVKTTIEVHFSLAER